MLTYKKTFQTQTLYLIFCIVIEMWNTETWKELGNVTSNVDKNSGNKIIFDNDPETRMK